MSKIVLTSEQRREYAEYRAVCSTHSEARWAVMTAEQRQMWARQSKAAAALLYIANPRRAILLRKKRNAAQRGIEFTITEVDLDWPTHCPVLGVELDYSGINKSGRRGGNRTSATIDRRDNSRGYVPGNVVIVSYWVNIRKGDATVEQLRQIAAFYNG